MELLSQNLKPLLKRICLIGWIWLADGNIKTPETQVHLKPPF